MWQIYIIISQQTKTDWKKLKKNIHFSVAELLIFGIRYLSAISINTHIWIGRLVFESDTMLAKMKHASYPFEYIMGNSNANVSIHRNNS